jgi:hypothetical protein
MSTDQGFYQGSLAQQYIDYSISVTVLASLGSQFQNVMIFIDDGDADDNIVDPPGVGEYLVVENATFADLVKLDLLDQLREFFANNSLSKVYIVEYDSETSNYEDIAVQFAKYKELAYFKLCFESAAGAQIELAELCDAHNFSQCWIGTSDDNCFDPDSVTSIAHFLNVAGVNPHLEYHKTAANSALCQLGLSLGKLNNSGFAVGNSLDYKNTNTIGASGVAGANLTATQVNGLKEQFIGYWSTAGFAPFIVAQFGGRTLKGDICGADWFIAFIEFMCSAQGIQYLTDPNTNHYRNNDTYQGLLSILQNNVNPFVSIQLISNFKITAPQFSQLADTGDSFIVPNAWVANFNDTVHKATVQGQLIVVEPTP